MLYLDHVTSPSASLRDPHMLAEAGWGGGKGLAGVLLLLLVEKFYATLKSLLCGSIVRSTLKNLDLYSTCKGTLQMFK